MKKQNNDIIWLVPDTNVYLHYKWFEEIPWLSIAQELFGDTNLTVGIGVPEKVIQEISDKKDSSKDKIRKRARKTSSAFSDIFLENKKISLPVSLIPLPKDLDFDDINFHKSNNDDVILLSIKKWDNSENTIVVSGDLPMLIKAKNNAMRYYKITDEYRLSNVLSDEERKIKELQEKLSLYENKMSNIRILFAGAKDKMYYKKSVKRRIEDELKLFRNELELQYPKGTFLERNDLYSSLSPSFQKLHKTMFSEDEITEYDKDREEFIEESLYEQKMIIIAEKQKESFKELSLFVDNISGTAASGNLNVEVLFPQGLTLYEQPREVYYNEPIKPIFGNPRSHQLFLQSFSNMGGRDQKTIEMWTKDDIIKSNIIHKEMTGVNHHMSMLLLRGIWIDTSECNSFTIEWKAVDSENPKLFSGKLDIILE